MCSAALRLWRDFAYAPQKYVSHWMHRRRLYFFYLYSLCKVDHKYFSVLFRVYPDGVTGMCYRTQIARLLIFIVSSQCFFCFCYEILYIIVCLLFFCCGILKVRNCILCIRVLAKCISPRLRLGSRRVLSWQINDLSITTCKVPSSINFHPCPSSGLDISNMPWREKRHSFVW